MNCRSGKDSTDYDLVVGGVANDKVFNTLELFFDGLIDKAIAVVVGAVLGFLLNGGGL